MKKYISLGIFVLIIFIQINCFGKYIFEQNFTIANLNIDRSPPEIEVIEIKNTNTAYEKYANKTHQIKIQVAIKEETSKINFIKENITVYVGNIENKNAITQIQQIKNDKGNIVYEITLNKIDGNGLLTLKLKKGIVIDTSGNESEEKTINTQIKIDNIAPKGSFSENTRTKGKSEATITANEQIRSIEGWNLSESKLIIKKEFPSNIEYNLKITDLAQNETTVKISIKKATYIKLTFASHNSEVGWSYGYSNMDIAGKNAIKQFALTKTEALAFRVEGNIANDFVQFNGYVHTYWGEGKKATCSNSGMIFAHGYNPSSTTFKTMNSKDLVTIEGKKYMQIGGGGLNLIGKTDNNGNRPIPPYECSRYLFGVSGIKAKLKDTTNYSIIYQVYIIDKGWIAPKYDGEEALYSHDKPMSAIRMVIAPKTEKKYILEMWKKDIGTSNGIYN